MNLTKLSLCVLATTLGSLAFAQSSKLKGRVLDENGNPLSNVKLYMKDDPQTQVITDEKGNYFLNLPANATPVIVISKDGYESLSTEVALQNNENRVTYADVVLHRNATLIEGVVITDNPSLISNSVSLSRKKLDKIAGGTNLADLKALSSQRSQTLKDALHKQPGVVIQEFFGGNDQPRLNVRGSGIQSNPQSRGIALLQDGIPINFSDGAYIIGVLEPQASNLVEIYRGANALEYGGSTLGGAMNFVTKNGYNASPLSLKVEGGSFDYYNVAASSGFVKGKNDVFASVSYNHSNGFREHNASRRFNALLNMGRRFSENFESRLYASFTDLYFDIPGPLTRYQMETDRKQIGGAPVVKPPHYAAGPNVKRDHPNRSAKIARIGSKSVYKIDKNNTLSGMLYFQFAEDQFTYPLPYNMRRDLNNDYGIKVNYDNKSEKNDFSLGAQFGYGVMRQSFFLHKGGERAGLFARENLKSYHNVIYLSDTYKFTDKFLANVAVQASWDSRKIEDLYTAKTRPFIVLQPNGTQVNVPVPNPTKNIGGSFDYFGFNPKVGAIYKPKENVQLYSNFSLSYEPPTFLEIVNISGGFNPLQKKFGPSNMNSSGTSIEVRDLKAQKASTFELGTKGDFGKAFVWNVSFYNSWVKDEIFTLSTDIGIGGETINAPYNTIHRGIEAGLQSTFVQNVFSSKGDSFTAYVNYNWSDFYFAGGGDLYKNKQVAGIPEHYSFVALDYKHPIGVFAEVNAESIWTKTPTDHRNTVYQDPYTLIGAKLGYKWNKWTVFVQGNNLADKVYASSYLIRDIVPTPPLPVPPGAPKPTNENIASFIPGVGRNFVAGMNFTF
ncbi:TonB-dependent receptor [Bergeyella cardium]|uniref:TonB-dependent receptor n=1 Tax=Bergeyella cardium TaxID=1585976 RepID=A0A6P1QWU0_9FLAO|nr:TonB-dependent receptor [Bergeyella cardium]QHN65607.1 TonB-dependent receptor [Bergeyella cardium]WHE33194.1 TonB-dependent receptor [Bergeyella cardium]WHF59844.1 TonB-dependent receptor [Bergeyella cardium]